MVASVAGCVPDRGQQLAECGKEADRFLQAYQSINPDDPRSEYIIECMAAKGYNFNVLSVDCDSKRPFPVQPACYELTGWPICSPVSFVAP